MNKLTQHIPNFAYNGEGYESWEFETKEDLLSLDWVKKFADKNSTFCVTDSNTLMIVKNNCSHWWVVGYLDKPVDLPKWQNYRIVHG